MLFKVFFKKILSFTFTKQCGPYICFLSSSHYLSLSIHHSLCGVLLKIYMQFLHFTTSIKPLKFSRKMVECVLIVNHYGD